MRSLIVLLVVPWLVGCNALSHNVNQAEGPSAHLEAEKLLETGELYRARKITEGILSKDPRDPVAQHLMAEILDEEIAREKDVLAKKPPEEFTKEETSEEVKTWLERSRSLLDLGQFDLALEAVEKVFVYEPDNQKASRLIDEIKQRAFLDGKKDMLVRSELLRSEIQDRVHRYQEQADTAVSEGRWGTARLAVQKILLLSPEDPEALKMQDDIQRHTG